MSDAKLLKWVMSFRKGIVGNKPSKSFCFMVCYPLSSALEMMGIKNTLMQGDVIVSNHCWLQLADGRVLDPTADQFNDLGFGWPKLPPVYLGEPSMIHSNPDKEIAL